ncbi:hypothetical protein K435DRAFT_641387, partial [Dendrothele bispora CBS 962.96]
GVYCKQARSLARAMTAAGCSRQKVGQLMRLMARTFGIELKFSMSRRTVSRAILEGGVAAKLQVAYEVLHTDGKRQAQGISLYLNFTGMTISQDSTSNRKQNYESHHFTPKAPDYDEVARLQKAGIQVKPTSIPRIRLFSLDATLDHGSEGSINEWKNNLQALSKLFNDSPLARRLNRQFRIHDFWRVTKGMHGDHANNEKSCANGIRDIKHDVAIEELGEKKLKELAFEDLVLYLALWNAKKLADIGGIDVWNQLSGVEQAERDAALMSEIITDLGQHEYDSLAEAARREIDLFVWSGCCMHKDQNSFKGGNAEMMAEWDKLGIEPPILLANKSNAAILHRVFEPGRSYDKLSEVERKALEETTRGGAKAMDLAGALFNNKDDKKGQGDVHVNFMKEHLGKNHPRFPDTSNTRFGSHGLAAAEIIKHLELYIKFVKDDIPYSKTYQTRTNIELNLLRALEDKATLTELCAMVLYTNVISHPYMRVVRGEEVNALDLGPLHAEVQTHIKKILDDPDLLFGENASFETAALDSKEWEDAKAVNAVFELATSLPHLQAITLAFFRGSLATWIRFSAEFAPGGLIDEASAEERYLAWMPSTNDCNEGLLSHYRVTVRNKPTLTLHQFNAQAMYSRNDTLSFMNALFEDEDHHYIMKVAREWDSSGLEAKRRAEQVAFRRRLVEMNKAKEEAKRRKAIELREKLRKIPLIRSLAELDSVPRAELDPKGSRKWTGHIYDLQLEALRFRSVPIPKKNQLKRVPEKLQALRAGFTKYLELLQEMGRIWPSSVGIENLAQDDLPVEAEWHEEEDMEVEE